MEIPRSVEFILKTLEKNGYEAYLTGGCVRDYLLGSAPKDWDICTSALPQQTKECFKEFTVADTGMKHGTVTVIIDHEPLEITTYRVDGNYTDHRHPQQVSFVSDLKEDLSRRDFTINAMAFHPKEGLIDYFGGKEDLQQRRLRCVGNPADRFKEDALRIMRALRFSAQFSLSIGQSEKDAIHQNKEWLQFIAVERLQVELCKMLCGADVGQILREFYDVIGVFIPELLPMVGFAQNNPFHEDDVFEHTVKSVIAAPADRILRLTLFFHDIAKPDFYVEDAQGIGHFYGHPQGSHEFTLAIMKRLHFDKETIKQVAQLVLEHDAELLPQKRSLKRWLNKIGEERLRQLLLVKRADGEAHVIMYRKKRLEELEQAEHLLEEILQEQQCFQLKDLAINGDDLLKVGLSQGKQMGILLQHLLEQVLDETVKNTRVELMRAAKRYIDEEINVRN